MACPRGEAHVPGVREPGPSGVEGVSLDCGLLSLVARGGQDRRGQDGLFSVPPGEGMAEHRGDDAAKLTGQKFVVNSGHLCSRAIPLPGPLTATN